MKQISNKKKYTDKISGKKYSQADINREYLDSAKEYLQNQSYGYDYNYCEYSGLNAMCSKLDIAHIVSRKKCKELGRIELIWDKRNFCILARKWHIIYDGLGINPSEDLKHLIDRFMAQKRLNLDI